MDEELHNTNTTKMIRLASKSDPGADTGLRWLLLLLADGDADERPFFLVAKTLKNEVKEFFKEEKKRSRWARGTIRVDPAGLRFEIEDSKKLKPVQANKLLKREIVQGDLATVKPILKDAEFVELVDVGDDDDGEGPGDDRAAEARCERARDKAKEAFLAIKGKADPRRVEELVALRDEATEARTARDFETATELYLDLAEQCRDVDLSGTDVRALAAAWREAIETIDGQIAALQRALKQTDDAELHEIAELGLNALTGDHRVPLQRALLAAQGAEGEKLAEALREVAERAAEFREHLLEEEIVEACDDNPFGVEVTLRRTLGPVLAQLAAAA